MSPSRLNFLKSHAHTHWRHQVRQCGIPKSSNSPAQTVFSANTSQSYSLYYPTSASTKHFTPLVLSVYCSTLHCRTSSPSPFSLFSSSDCHCTPDIVTYLKHDEPLANRHSHHSAASSHSSAQSHCISLGYGVLALCLVNPGRPSSCNHLHSCRSLVSGALSLLIRSVPVSITVYAIALTNVTRLGR